jgi:hypothetical protein
MHERAAGPAEDGRRGEQQEKALQLVVIGRGRVTAPLQPGPQRPAHLCGSVLAYPAAVLARPAARVLIDLDLRFEVEAPLGCAV